MAERSLRMREVRGSIPCDSIFFFAQHGTHPLSSLDVPRTTRTQRGRGGDGRRRRTTDASRVAFVARGGARRARAPLAGVPRDRTQRPGVVRLARRADRRGALVRAEGPGAERAGWRGRFPASRRGVAARARGGRRGVPRRRQVLGVRPGARGRGRRRGRRRRVLGKLRRGHAAAREPRAAVPDPRRRARQPRGRGLGGGRARGARAHRRAHARPPGPGEGGRGGRGGRLRG